MKANEIIKKYNMDEHVENGSFREHDFMNEAQDRASSGSIYYYVPQGETTEFHRIDCDEYWCYNAGATLELWVFDVNGELRKPLLGVDAGAEPMILIRKGEIFASRSSKTNDDGTFITCITVPKFSYEGFELFDKEKMLELYPETNEFWSSDYSIEK